MNRMPACLPAIDYVAARAQVLTLQRVTTLEVCQVRDPGRQAVKDVCGIDDGGTPLLALSLEEVQQIQPDCQ